MKKWIFIVALGMMSSSVQAQKGDFHIGVNANTSQYDYLYGYYGYFSWLELMPEVGYYVNDRLVVGVGYHQNNRISSQEILSYNPFYPDITEEINYFTSLSSVRGKTFAQFYFDKLFVRAGIEYRSSVNNSYSESPYWTDSILSSVGEWEYETVTEEMGVSLALGYSLKYNDKIRIEPSLSVGQHLGSTSYYNRSVDADGMEHITDQNPVEHSNLKTQIGVSVHLQLGKD